MTQLDEAHVVVLGAGYGGLRAAFGLARKVRVTLIDPDDSFTERVRLHERAAGREDVRHALWPLLRASGVTHLSARVSRIDTASAEVHTDGGRLTVVGGGLTGIETAAELAESHPEWEIRLVTGGKIAPSVSRRGRAHIRSVLTDLGVAIEEDRQIAGAADVDSDLVVWSASMVPNTEIAKAAGLAVDGLDRITVDAALRSVSHPKVYVAGDAAAAYTTVSGPLRMACATALPVGLHAARSVVRDLRGLEPLPLKFSYSAQCMSLGRRDGLLQFVAKDDTPRDRIVTGRAAALVKEQIIRTTVRTISMTARHPRTARLIPGVN
ncbi:hypothetical protein GCM10023194_53890 [Planotetraspora phitsanulokensis]|uniref:FAD/NAD(P)-binding domain-containing protein n=1 Tax=Planotetraspora phitsanulokensis TaxID=575192 RepID=A0A8J3U166_9ACTN|nr:FAD-dependent oxidoreductase [Planotetraspora phitsanulokensis]GII36643.1 hypothetical protein Pph01_16460 [Planotetraspora phitsanulokensis]